MGRMRWDVFVAVIIAVAVVGYVAGPLWAGWQLRQAILKRDTVALRERVDWPQLRANLKPHLSRVITETTGPGTGMTGAVQRTLGRALAGPAVDVFVSPANLARLLAGREFMLRRFPATTAPRPASPAAGTPDGATSEDDPEDVDDPVPPRRLRWAFFDSPTRFRVEATNPRIAPYRTAAILALQGWTWKLVDIEFVKR